MPFFHLAGNHDIKAGNQVQVGYWNSMFGRPYYSFRYKDVLFLSLFSNESFQTLSEEQVAYFSQVIRENEDVRWTLLFMHHPLWTYKHKSNFGKIEKLLEGRDYTVFAGHEHTYRHFDHQGSRYFILATTGGGSGLLGNSFGQFDHVTWITMSDDGPDIVNMRLDGILPADISNTESVALGRELIKSVFYQTEIFVDDNENVKNGRAYLTYNNTTEHPLKINAKFLHSHHLDMNPSKIDLTVPGKATETIAIELKALQSFSLDEKIKLELDGTVQLQHPDYPDLKLSGTQPVKIQVSSYDVLPTQEIDFIGSYVVTMNPPLPGTTIHYSLDGSDPGINSPIFSKPIEISQKTVVKARLVTEDGMTSAIDEMQLTKINSGKGLLCKYYEYNSIVELGKVPDFSTMKPVSTKVVQQMDLGKAGPRNEFFGLVYKGLIDLPESGRYTFSTISDDGSILFIDDKPVVVDAVKHKPRETFGEMTLSKGKHPFELHYYQHKKAMILEVYYQSPSGGKHKVKMSQFSFAGDQPELTIKE